MGENPATAKIFGPNQKFPSLLLCMGKDVITLISTVCNQKYLFLDLGTSHHVYKGSGFIRTSSRLNDHICINYDFSDHTWHLNEAGYNLFHYVPKSCGVYGYLCPSDYGQWLNLSHHRQAKMLISLNLLIEHGEKEERGKSYQVHPLVREFIHKNYDKTIQKPFVDKLVKMIIGNNLYTIIFVNAPDTISGNMDQWNSRDIIDSVETCLTSRNDVDALTILSSTYEILVNDGHHAEFLSLGERVLDSVNWEKEEMGINKKRAAFLNQYLNLLVLQEQSKPKVEFYLTNYENSCEKNTIPYSGFLGTKALVLWRCEKFREAMQAFRNYEAIQEKTKEAWNFSDMENLKGMILREIGEITGALEVFEEITDSSAKYGNIARCYQISGKYDLALDNLKICLSKLANRDNLFTENVNRGYAYLWIAEIYYEMGEKDKAEKFLLLCQETWKEYAPGLLPKTSELLKKIGDIEMQLNPLDIQQMLDDFLGNVQDAE